MANAVANFRRHSAPPHTFTSSTTLVTAPPNFVEIYVGDTNRKFILKYNLVVTRSRFIKTALDNLGGGPLKLSVDAAEVFHDYVECLKYGPDKVKVNVEDEKKIDVFTGLIEVWIMAEYMEDFRTANEVVDEMQRRHMISRTLPSADSINIVWAQTDKYSRLRRLVEDYFVHEATPRDYEALRLTGVVRDFLFDVAREQRVLIDQAISGVGKLADGLAKRVDQMPKCDYHLFDDQGCASCRFAKA